MTCFLTYKNNLICYRSEGRNRRMAKLVIFTVVVITIFSFGVSVDDKCSACNAVAVCSLGISLDVLFPQSLIYFPRTNMGVDAVQEELESQLLKVIQNYNSIRSLPVSVSMLVQPFDVLLSLKQEKPRNHLDLRNRLNSKGQREGKVIDYRYVNHASLSAQTFCNTFGNMRQENFLGIFVIVILTTSVDCMLDCFQECNMDQQLAATMKGK